MRKVKCNGEETYIDDTPLDENETGKLINKIDKLDKALEIDKTLGDNTFNKIGSDNYG